jgi:hypothetical protein
LCGGENREKGWAGMVHLPRGDVRKPGSKRSFLAGETESVFEPPIGALRMSFITALGMLPKMRAISYRVSALPGCADMVQIREK